MEEIAQDVRYCREIQSEVMDSHSINLKIRRNYMNENDDYWQRYRFTRLADGSGYWTYARRFHASQEDDLLALVKAQA